MRRVMTNQTWLRGHPGHFLPVMMTLLAFVLAAQDSHRAELFDTSGMPRRPNLFVEQQIFEMIGSHKAGDLSDAMRIQRKLGGYYQDKGDEARANTAFLRAAEAERALNGPPAAPAAEAPAPDVGRPLPAQTPLPVSGSRFTGNYYGYDGRTLHTWEFRADGTFLHTWIASGAGTSVRNSERGRFAVSGNILELRIDSAAGGFVTPGAGGRTTVSGGSSSAAAETRRLRIQFVKGEGAVVLDGLRLKPKSW